MGFSKQEYWSGLPFPSPEDLPDPGIKLRSPALQADSLLFELQGSLISSLIGSKKGTTNHQVRKVKKQSVIFILPALHTSKFNFSELLLQTSVDSDRATVGHCFCPVMLVINWA